LRRQPCNLLREQINHKKAIIMETAEQIQKSIIPEPPVGEGPAPSLSELPPQAPEPDTPQPDGESQAEAALTSEIVQLWQVHQDCQSAIKQETQEFRSVRSELGKRLSEMKQLLVRPGRGGEWSGWLRAQRIPRATADRLVSKYERFLNPDRNRLTAQFSEPTDAEIQSLFDKLAPKLRKLLRTTGSAYKFIDLLTASFEGVERRVIQQGILILNPAKPAQAVIEQSAPEESKVELVPVIAEVPVEAHSESVGT